MFFYTWKIENDRIILDKDYGLDGYIMTWTNPKPKKILACTDKSLKIEIGDSGWKSDQEGGWNEYKPEYKELPRPSNDFIEAYVKAQGKGFEKVLVNYYQNQRWYAERDIGYRCSNCNYVVGKIIYPRNIKCKCDFELKVASDNTITIIPFEEKQQTFTREEFKKALELLYFQNGGYEDEFEEWFNKNY